MRRGLVGGLLLCSVTAAGAAPAQPAATLDAAQFPASATADTLLHIRAPGRLAITVHSATGVALDLVDMITGPTPQAGAPGSADGRLDQLLDTGAYKIRLHPAAGAKGDMQLRVTAFTDAAPPAIMPRDAETDAALADLQQRSFWFTADGGPVRLEAAGRALADLRLWRDGRELVPTTAVPSIIEPTHGHPLRDILITGPLPAGVYRATAYGGPALPWPDGSQAQPFHIRAGAPDTLRPGWVGGKIGPFGSALFRAAGADDLFRLSAEGPASLRVDQAETPIDKKSRIPAADLRVAAQDTDHWVTVTAPEATPFQLRATMIGARTSLSNPGTWFVTANTTGLGGDDVPATLVLARSNPHGWTVAGSNAPEIGQRAAWHHRFSLGGQVSLLFHATDGGKLAATITGVRLGSLELTALDALASHPPVSPDSPGVWDVPAGWYALTLAPAGDTAGVADLTLGPPGVAVPLSPPSPPSPLVTFGAQTVAWRDTLRLFGNGAPDAAFGLDARPVPVALAHAPLRVSQEPGAALAIPVQREAGLLTATEYGRGPVPVAYDRDTGMASLPATDHARLVALARDVPMPPPAMPVPEAEAARPVLHDNAARFFDLGEGRERRFTLDVGAGGLFRVETLGRLHTKGAIGSRFAPVLNQADGNGIGQNMLLQGFLRAGQYHVDVTAQESGGHTGILASPASLLTAATLLPGGSVRATMPAGTGLLVPLAIVKAGRYRIDLLGLSKTFSARLEDAQGWPFAASAPFDTSTQDLTPGLYRLLVSPEATDARAVVRLTRIETPPPLTGHGPHALAFDAAQAFIWREPAGRNDPRVPDSWRFGLAAAADVTVSITDGMQAALRAPDGHSVVHIAGGVPFSGRLPPGAYTIEATSQGRNDRLDYTVSLGAAQVQPGVPRALALPSSIGFAVASEQVISLTSFGATPVRAVLKDGAGRVLGRFAARDNDWNLAVSRALPAGAYSLDLASAAPPPQHATPRNINDAAVAHRGDTGRADEGGQPAEAGTGDAAPGAADQNPEPDAADQPAADEPGPAAAAPPQGGDADTPEASPAAIAPAPPDADADADADAGAAPAGMAPNTTEVTLTLPADLPPVALAGGAMTLAGGGVHRATLPRPAPGQLILAGASSAAELVLSLDQQNGGAWHSRALAQGLDPILALPADAATGAYRLSVWAMDGGSLPIAVAARIETLPASPGPPRLQPAPLPGVSATVQIAHVALPSPGVVTVSGAAANAVLAGFWPGHQATIPDAGLIAPQAPDLWLVAPTAGALTLAPLPAGAALTMTLPEGARAALPAATGLRAWIAEAPGQPGLEAGHGMGVAEGSAFALTSGGTGTVWNAGGNDALRVTVHPVGLTLMPAQMTLDARPSWVLPAATAAAITLPAGLHTLRLDLPPGTAAVAGWLGPHAVTAWSGHAAVSRTLQGDWATLMLVNTGSAPATIGLAADTMADGAPVASLRPDHAEKRFFGAAGAIDMPITAANGQILVVAGNASATVLGDDGSVRRGRRIRLMGSGRVTLEHGTGLAAAWIQGGGAAPWPAPKPVTADLPSSLALSGPSMQLDLSPAAPTLLRIRSTAPVILALNGGAPTLSAAGAAESHYLPAGHATLRIIAPQDGGLTGSLDLTTAPIRAAAEGLGAAVTVAPGDTALFGFTLAGAARVGMAIRAQPDDASLALLDAAGHWLNAGAAMLRDLPAGRYILSATVPRGGQTTVMRPAILGLVPHPNGPPPDIIHFYRELAGLAAPKDATP